MLLGQAGVVDKECIIGMKDSVILQCYSEDAHSYIWEFSNSTGYANTRTINGSSILTLSCSPEYNGLHHCSKIYQDVAIFVITYNFTAVERNLSSESSRSTEAVGPRVSSNSEADEISFGTRPEPSFIIVACIIVFYKLVRWTPL